MGNPAVAVNLPDFPYAPETWSVASALYVAEVNGINLTDGHWDMVRALHEYFARHADDASINTRELHDALDECFHALGGMKHLYHLFPGGPITQGCEVAGLEPPAGSSDSGFGSVQ